MSLQAQIYICEGAQVGLAIALILCMRTISNMHELIKMISQTQGNFLKWIELADTGVKSTNELLAHLSLQDTKTFQTFTEAHARLRADILALQSQIHVQQDLPSRSNLQ